MTFSRGDKALIGGALVFGCLAIIFHFVLLVLAFIAVVTGTIDWIQNGPDTWAIVRVVAGGIYLIYAIFNTRITTNSRT